MVTTENFQGSCETFFDELAMFDTPLLILPHLTG